MLKPGYTYKAIVQSVYDGDTITVDIDLGLNVWLKGQKLRLYGIDTPELRGPDREEGLKVRDYVRERISCRENKVIIETIKDRTGKYGRWLAVVWVEGINLNEELVRQGMAVEYLKD